MTATAPMLTYDDLAETPDDGRRYEIVAGDIVVTPSPHPVHQEGIALLLDVLRGFVRPRHLGWVIPAPVDVQLSRHDIVQPDILFLSNRDLARLPASPIVVIPDLVVEVLSASTRARDVGRKRELYARAGIPEYWMADVDDRSLEGYTWRDGEYAALPLLNRILGSRVLPGLEVDVEALFADLV